MAVTYHDEKAEYYVRPLAEELGSEIILPMDVLHHSEVDAVFDAMAQRRGSLDFLLHSIAFAPREDLHARVTDCSLDGFLTAMIIYCHSFIRMARRAEPLMKENGGCLLTMTFYGSERVVADYNLMGPRMKRVEDDEAHEHVELEPKEARQGRLGRPVFVVLLVSLLGALIVIGLTWAFAV